MAQVSSKNMDQMLRDRLQEALDFGHLFIRGRPAILKFTARHNFLGSRNSQIDNGQKGLVSRLNKLLNEVWTDYTNCDEIVYYVDEDEYEKVGYLISRRFEG